MNARERQALRQTMAISLGLAALSEFRPASLESACITLGFGNGISITVKIFGDIEPMALVEMNGFKAEKFHRRPATVRQLIEV
jgi:hypothetical protein